MEPCMNSNGTYNCSIGFPVFNVTQPSWCLESTTDEPSTTITDIITTLVSNATTSLFTKPTTSSRDEPSTTITDIITTLVSNATTSLFTEPATSSTVTPEKPEPTDPSIITTPEPPEVTEEDVPWWIWCIVAVVVIAATTCIIIFILWCKKKKEDQSRAASELHCDDPHFTLQSQTSKVGLIGTDEPDGGGIKTNSKENETGSHKIVEIEEGEESKDGCYVEVKSAPIVLTTDL